MLILFKSFQLFLDEMFKILDKRFFLVEWVVVVLNDCSRCEIEHKILPDKILLACIESKKSLQQEVSNPRKDEIVFLPIKFDKSLLAGHIEAHKPFEELSSLHVLLKSLLIP